MSKKKQKLRQERNLTKKIIDEVMSGEMTEKDFFTPQDYQNYKNALELPPSNIQDIMNITYPLAIEEIKNKRKVILLAKDKYVNH